MLFDYALDIVRAWWDSDTVFARAKLGYCSDSSIAQGPEISRTFCKQISFPLKMGRLIAGSFNDTTTQNRTLTGVDSSHRNYAQKAPLLWITLWPPSAQRNVSHMNSHPPRPFRRSLLFTPVLYHIWGQISNEQFVYKSFELINGIEKRAVMATARSLCLNSLCLKMDRLIAGLLR